MHEPDRTTRGWSSSRSWWKASVLPRYSFTWYSRTCNTTEQHSPCLNSNSCCQCLLKRPANIGLPASSTPRPCFPSSFLQSFKLLYDSVLLLDCSLKREDAKQNKALAWNKMNNYSGRDSFSLAIAFHTFSHSYKESSTCPLHHSAKIIKMKSRNLLSDIVSHVVPPLPSSEYWAYRQIYNMHGIFKNLTEVYRMRKHSWLAYKLLLVTK